MITEEYMIKHFDGYIYNIVCTTTSQTWAKRFIKIMTKWVIWNYDTMSKPQTNWNIVEFENGQRIYIDTVKRITDLKSFKALF